MTKQNHTHRKEYRYTVRVYMTTGYGRGYDIEVEVMAPNRKKAAKRAVVKAENHSHNNENAKAGKTKIITTEEV